MSHISHEVSHSCNYNVFTDANKEVDGEGWVDRGEVMWTVVEMAQEVVCDAGKRGGEKDYY